jgi:hypothetical protein
MTDVPWWDLAPYAGLAGSILWLAWWFLGVRHALPEKGWKHFSRVIPVLAVYILASSAYAVLLGSPPAMITGVLILILLAMIVVGTVLDLAERTRPINLMSPPR